MELFSCCIEESVSQQPDVEESDEDRTISPRSSSFHQAHHSNNDKINNELDNSAQVR